MKFLNTPQLKAWLERDHPELAIQSEFEIDAATFHRFRKQLHAQGDHKHPNARKEAEALDQVALFAALTYSPPKKPPVAITETPEGESWLTDPGPVPVALPPSLLTELGRLRAWLRLIAVILFLLLAKTVHGQSIASGDITASNASCTATSCVSLSLYGQSGTVAIQVTNTFTGTLQFEGSADGTNVVAVNGLPVASATTTTSTTATGVWQASVSGLQKFQVRASALSSGTASITLRASPAAMGRGNGGSSIQLTGDVTAGPGSSPLATTVAKVDGVSYPASPSTNTVPVVTSSNVVTYEAVPSAVLNITTTTCTNQFVRSLSSGAVGTCATVANTDLTNSSITLNAGTSTGYTAPGAMSLGSTYTFGATTDVIQQLRLGLGQAADATASLSATQTALGATTTDGAILKNTTSAAAGAQQFSPALHLIGQGWKTAATAATQQTDYTIDVEPIQATTHPISALFVRSNVNGSGTGAIPLIVCGVNSADSGKLLATGIVLDGQTASPCLNSSGWSGMGNMGASNIIAIVTNASIRAHFNVNNFLLASDYKLGWSATAAGGFTTSTTADIALARNAAGVLEVDSGTAGTFRDIIARTYYGNTTATGTLALVSTSGVGTTDSITLGVGNNGATVMVTVNSAGVAAASTLTMGAAGGTTGAALFKGTTSGTVTQTVAAAAGTWTFTLPTSGGTNTYAMTTNGSGTASWVGGQSISGLTTSDTPQFTRLSLGTTDGGGGISINATGAAVFGSTAAASGQIRLPNNTSIAWRNAANSADILAVAVNGSNQVDIGVSGTRTNVNGTVFMANVTTSSSATSADACFSSGEIVNDTALCVVSARRFKNTIEDSPLGLGLIEKLRPVQYYLNESPERGQQFGLIAEEVEAIDKRFVTYQTDGQIRSVLYLNLIPVLIKAVQQLQARLAASESK